MFKKLLLAAVVITSLAPFNSFAGSNVPPLSGGAAIHLSLTVGTSSTLALPTDGSRGFLQIQNTGTSNNLACAIDGSTPVINGNGIQLSPGVAETST